MKGFIKDEIPSRWDEKHMTHDELSKKLEGLWHDSYKAPGYMMLRNVVELHKPKMGKKFCKTCGKFFPCSTIQAIEKELK